MGPRAGLDGRKILSPPGFDPGPSSLVRCLAKNFKKDSIVSVDMDNVGVMAAYSDCN